MPDEEVDEIMSLDDATDEDGEAPSMTSPQWHDYVMSKFEPDELDAEGNPKVTGLRRVARQLLGPIVRSEVNSIRSPEIHLDEDNSGILSMATVEYRMTFLWCRPEDLPQGGGAYEVHFSDIADVYKGNTDAEYARHPSAMAATRAEGRCLRKALQLQRVISAEESTKVPVEESGVNGIITPTQINFIDTLCRRCDINVVAYMNAGSRKYQRVEDVAYGVAGKMVSHLSSMQNDSSQIPDNLKGYVANWRK